MPVFDFNAKTEEKVEVSVTYTAFDSDRRSADRDNPFIVISNKSGKLKHHSCGMFTSPTKGTGFVLDSENGESITEDILRIDSRFVSLVKWLGDSHVMVRLSGVVKGDEYWIYKMMETGIAVRGAKLAGENGFLQFMLKRLFQSEPPVNVEKDLDDIEDSDNMKLTSVQSIADFLLLGQLGV